RGRFRDRRGCPRSSRSPKGRRSAGRRVAPSRGRGRTARRAPRLRASSTRGCGSPAPPRLRRRAPLSGPSWPRFLPVVHAVSATWIVALELLPQALARQPERARGACAVAARLFERLGDAPRLELGEFARELRVHPFV